jgi:hypothetical protein
LSKLDPFLLALIRSRIEEPQFVRSFDARFRKEFARHYPNKTLFRKGILDFYSKAAKLILKEFEIDKVLERTSKESRDFARIIMRTDDIDRLLERHKNYIPELVPEWQQARNILTTWKFFFPLSLRRSERHLPPF